MSHACQCQSDARRIALLLDGAEADNAELDKSRRAFGWPLHAELGVLEVPLGAGARFAGLAELADFLRTLEPDRFADFRGAWLEPDTPVAEQLRALLHAEPLARMAPVSSSPLSGILAQRALTTWFQPVFELPALRIWGYECLMRAFDAAGELINPGQLIGWARGENLIFMLDRVCREMHIANAARAPVPAHCRFLINFLPSVIYDPEVCLRTTLAAAEANALDAGRVIFEVVETEVIEDREHLRGILDHYRSYGFGVALDDIGAGHSGLQLLGDLSPDLIKIDRELIARAPASSIHYAICRSLVDIARGENKLVLAEGVEKASELELVRQLGVDLVQGYLFGRPAAEPVTEPLAAAREAMTAR